LRKIRISDDFDEPMILVTESKLRKLISEARSYIGIGWDQDNESASLEAAIVDIEKELVKE